MYIMGKLDKGMIHIPGRMETDGTRFHQAMQNCTKFKLTNCLFLENFNIFRLWVTKTLKRETMDKEHRCI